MLLCFSFNGAFIYFIVLFIYFIVFFIYFMLFCTQCNDLLPCLSINSSGVGRDLFLFQGLLLHISLCCFNRTSA